MSNKKVATLAMLLALAGSGVAANAVELDAVSGYGITRPDDDCKCESKMEASARCTLTAKLSEFIKIVCDGGRMNTCIKPCGDLEYPLTPKFKVETNTAAKIYLQAKVDTKTNHDANALFEQGNVKYILFGNTSNGHEPTMTAYNNCKSGSPKEDNNADIIAYPVEHVKLTGATTSTPTYDKNKNEYDIHVNSGCTDVTATIGTKFRNNTFGDEDKAGTYKSEIILTTASL